MYYLSFYFWNECLIICFKLSNPSILQILSHRPYHLNHLHVLENDMRGLLFMEIVYFEELKQEFKKLKVTLSF